LVAVRISKIGGLVLADIVGALVLLVLMDGLISTG